MEEIINDANRKEKPVIRKPEYMIQVQYEEIDDKEFNSLLDKLVEVLYGQYR